MKLIWIAALITLLIFPGAVLAYDTSYSVAGTYTWTCPANVTLIFVQMAGGGGSGKSTGWLPGWSYNEWGYGGSAGQYGNITMVPVVPGTNYTIVVGAGGATSTAYGVSNAGGTTTAFGYTKLGGAGGLQGGYSAANGGVGETTNFFSLVAGGAAGGNSGAYTGGAGGIGFGAGGGGAASDASTSYGTNATTGGSGTVGIVAIWDMNGSAANVPYYTASPTTATMGTVVTFTDESLLHDSANLTYDWDFGDGTTHSTTVGSTAHVYSSYGVFTTNLTITSDVGSSSLVKTNYIAITATPITAWYTQKLVRLKVVDSYGNDLPGANVSINYIADTLPSHDATYLTSAFGISQTVAAQMTNGSTMMNGFTATDGAISAMMFPAIQYGITITNLSVGLSKYVTIYPQDNDYIIYCPLGTQAKPTSRVEHMFNSSLYVTEPNASWIMWNLYYQDTSGYTTGLAWNVTCWNNKTVMKSGTWGGVGTGDIVRDNYTFPSVPAGVEYRAYYQATRNVP